MNIFEELNSVDKKMKDDLEELEIRRKEEEIKKSKRRKNKKEKIIRKKY